MLFRISSLADNDRDAGYLEPVLNSLHEMNLRQESVEFLFGSLDGQVGLFCRVPASLKQIIVDQLADTYPTCTLEQIDEAVLQPHANSISWRALLALLPDVFPLREHPSFGDPLTRDFRDPVSGIFSSVRTGKAGRMRATISISLRPASSHRHRQARRVLAITQRKFPFEWTRDLYERWATHPRIVYRLLAWLFSLSTRSSGEGDRARDDKLSRHLFETTIECEVSAPSDAKDKALAKLTQMAAAFGAFTSNQSRFHILNVKSRRRRGFRGSLLSVREVATLWHPPVANVETQRQDRAHIRQLEPPTDLPSKETEPNVTLLGCALYRNQQTPFGLRLADRRQHTYIVGKSGTGKSTLLTSMAASDIAAGHGICFIDPHGDITKKLLDQIPRRRTNDVILFDPSDVERPVGFNPLAIGIGCTAERTADGVVSAFIKVFKLDQTITTRLLHILRNSVLTLVANPGSTLIGLNRILVDPAYRDHLLRNVENPAVRSFWLDEFDRWNDRQRTEYVASLQNKLGALLTSETLQNIFGQSKSQLDLRQIMDSRKVLLLNLSKGAVGEEGSHFLGALLLSLLQVAAMSRDDTPESDRADFMVYVDEQQNFVTDTFASILSESRKYRLSLTSANQYLSQLDTDGVSLRDAIFGNAGSIISFAVGPEDATFLAQQLGSEQLSRDLVKLPNYHSLTRLLINGNPQRPFVMKTIEPRPGQSRRETIVSVSKRSYGRPRGLVRAEVENAYNRA